MDRPAPRVPFAEASRTLLRNSVLDSVRDLLLERDWSKITLSDVAKRAGVSRQTLYNEFGSRAALAQAYALRLVDSFVDHVDAAVWGNVGDARAALSDAFRAFFVDSASDPLIQSLLSGEAKPDLLRLITLDSSPLVSRAAARLEQTFQNSWVDATVAESGILARAVVRLAMSFISIPPTSDHDVADELAALLGPFVETLVTRTRKPC